MKKILLIEDNSDILDNAAEILELSGYTVIKADNGKSGIEKAISQVPDLIVCDIMMPLLDGYGVLHAIKRHEQTKNIPFIFLTAKSERGDFRKGMELGADDYIVKPFNGSELLTAVESRLKKIEMLKKDFLSDIEGLNHLVQVASGNDSFQPFTEGRHINVYKKKQMVYSEGNYPNRVFYVVSGKVKTFKVNESGKELVTNFYNTGDFLGYVAMIEGTPYKETAEAIEDSKLAIIPSEEFDILINKNPQVARKFIKLLASNISEKENQLIGLAYNSLRKKVADALILLYNKYKVNDEKYIINMSREALASIAGTATESLVRTLRDFSNEKLIEISGGNIIILNQQKLENLRS